jgi:hypothetical protein
MFYRHRALPSGDAEGYGEAGKSAKRSQATPPAAPQPQTTPLRIFLLDGTPSRAIFQLRPAEDFSK